MGENYPPHRVERQYDNVRPRIFFRDVPLQLHNLLMNVSFRLLLMLRRQGIDVIAVIYIRQTLVLYQRMR